MEAQLEWNWAFAEALGALPSTLCGNNNINTNNINSGWARTSNSIPELNEFRNEVNTTVYPSSLILQACNKMDMVLKVELKWKAFLADHTATSMPLNCMDSPMHAMVHEYSDVLESAHGKFWSRTKTLYQLCQVVWHKSTLSALVRCGLQLARASHRWWFAAEKAGQSTSGMWSSPLPPIRVPLPLKMHSDTTATAAMPETTGMALQGAPHRSISDDDAIKEGYHFVALTTEREHPKLELQSATFGTNTAAEGNSNIGAARSGYQTTQTTMTTRGRKALAQTRNFSAQTMPLGSRLCKWRRGERKRSRGGSEWRRQ